MAYNTPKDPSGPFTMAEGQQVFKDDSKAAKPAKTETPKAAPKNTSKNK